MKYIFFLIVFVSFITVYSNKTYPVRTWNCLDSLALYANGIVKSKSIEIKKVGFKRIIKNLKNNEVDSVWCIDY